MYVITTDVFAKVNVKDPNTILRCYEQLLSHQNEGVVKSTIQNIMKLKTVYPELNYSKPIKIIEKLSVKSESKAIRFNAFVAVNYFKYPKQLEWNLPYNYKELDEFFYNNEINFKKSN